MKTFISITALFLCSLSWISGSSSELHTVEVKPGEEVTLKCSNISSHQTQTDWFRVVNKTKPSCISSMFGSYGQASFCVGFQNGKFQMSSNITYVFLQIKPVDLTDAGLYFCGFYVDVHIIISNAVELRIKGGESSDEDFKTEKEPDRMIHLMSIILGGLTGLLSVVVINLVLKIRKLQTAKEPQLESTKNMSSNDLNCAALTFQTKAYRSRRPTSQRELETYVVYAATR